MITLVRSSVPLLVAFALVAPPPSQESNEGDEQEVPCGWSKWWEDRDADKPIRCCSEDGPPNRLADAPIVFPESDVGHWAPPILLEIVIEPEGNVEEVEFVRRPVFKPPWPEAEDAIMEAMRKRRYDPTVADGKRVPVCMTVVITITWS